jgi:hypothetical protein
MRRGDFEDVGSYSEKKEFSVLSEDPLKPLDLSLKRETFMGDKEGMKRLSDVEIGSTYFDTENNLIYLFTGEGWTLMSDEENAKWT